MLPSWVRGNARVDLDRAKWALARVRPGETPSPRDYALLSRRMPVAAALEELALFRVGAESDIDDWDFWFRCRFDSDEALPRAELRLEAVAGAGSLWLDGEHKLDFEASFSPIGLQLSWLSAGSHEVTLYCPALAPLLAAKRPRPRYRTRLVKQQNLRFFRVPLLGRIPDTFPGAPLVGPYRPVWLERRSQIELTDLDLRAELDGVVGRIALRATASGEVRHATLSVGEQRFPLTLEPAGSETELSGTCELSDVEPWWPHTHGDQPRYAVSLSLDQTVVHLGSVGFRRIEASGLDGDFGLCVNGERVFCRGAVWSPPDFTGLGDAPLRQQLELARDAGFNMLRVPGVGVYASDEFYELCDELGILVWQDLMFASLDYPSDPDFAARVAREVRVLLARLRPRACLAVVAGSSETAQQAAMIGASPASPLFDEIIPALLRDERSGVAYIPSTPWGGERPFRLDQGVCHYYGVGAYGRELADVRRSGVRFASECLAFSNVPEPKLTQELCGGGAPAGPRWKAGIPRDPGAGWDFEDVRDTYLARRYAEDPVRLRARDPARYLELSRSVSGELMAAVLAELRATRAGGALVWLLSDARDGAGVGLIDARGTPKAAYWWARRVAQPVGMVLVDEGLNGLALHVWNETPRALSGTLQVSLYRDSKRVGQTVSSVLKVAARQQQDLDLESLLGGFVDVSYAYRFGPAGHDLVACSWAAQDGTLLAEAFHHPLGPPRDRRPLELSIDVAKVDAASVVLELRSPHYVHALHVDAGGAEPSDQYLCLEPQRTRRIALSGELPEALRFSALNATGSKWLSCQEQQA